MFYDKLLQKLHFTVHVGMEKSLIWRFFETFENFWYSFIKKSVIIEKYIIKMNLKNFNSRCDLVND